MEPLLRNTANASKFDHRVNETGADSRVGETVAADGVHFAGLPDGHRLAERSLPAHPQGRGRGRGRHDRRRTTKQDLEGNLQSLLDRAKSGTYRAPPVRRVHIPKGGSTPRPARIGIPTLEDKVLQRAVVMLLEPIYEQDFLDCSYGFRPGRSAHQALEAFRQQMMDSGAAGSWKWTSGSSSTIWIMRHLRGFSGFGCVTVCCCD